MGGTNMTQDELEKHFKNTFQICTFVLQDETGHLMLAPYGIAKHREAGQTTPIKERMLDYWEEAEKIYSASGMTFDGHEVIDLVEDMIMSVDEYKKAS